MASVSELSCTYSALILHDEVTVTGDKTNALIKAAGVNLVLHLREALPPPAAPAEEKKVEAKKEESEESDDDMGFGLFD
ncbi:60S acidic ribosomal protein P1 [Heterocephalus glaber]|uniref:60S acidic ribosomal protein P1 n=1 Tax=Heterocephalus glaber TaxID=10181 RepID=G5BA60_HETGA|nr:60S acidic ribosomal protein P1 [Heterocephalus glaber]